MYYQVKVKIAIDTGKGVKHAKEEYLVGEAEHSLI